MTCISAAAKAAAKGSAVKYFIMTRLRNLENLSSKESVNLRCKH